MKLNEKIILNSIKSLEDEYIGKFCSEIEQKKSDILNSIPGISESLSGNIFDSIKNLIGPFLSKFTNSINIVNSTKNDFLNKAKMGVEELTKDLL
jgi:hypothetical protein